MGDVAEVINKKMEEYIMKKILHYICAISLVGSVFMLSACGSGGRADEEFEGKYISVSGEALGITLTGEDISGFSLDLKSGGKGSMTVYGESESIEWTNDDENLTIDISGTEMVGEIGKDTLTFKNVLDMGMDLTYAKEGSEAAKPENVLPEEDKNMLGTWTSKSVTDVLGDPVEGMSGNELEITFTADHTAMVTYKGENLGTHKWSLLGDWGSLDTENLDISWDINDQGIEVNYSTADDYLIFSCTKQN